MTPISSNSQQIPDSYLFKQIFLFPFSTLSTIVVFFLHASKIPVLAMALLNGSVSWAETKVSWGGRRVCWVKHETRRCCRKWTVNELAVVSDAGLALLPNVWLRRQKCCMILLDAFIYPLAVECILASGCDRDRYWADVDDEAACSIGLGEEWGGSEPEGPYCCVSRAEFNKCQKIWCGGSDLLLFVFSVVAKVNAAEKPMPWNSSENREINATSEHLFWVVDPHKYRSMSAL